MTKLPFTPLALSCIGLAACQPAPPQSAATAQPVPNIVPNIVQGVCGDCHGVQPPFLSPNPAAPGFDVVANSAGLTRETATDWLVDAHNYPELMEFELTREEAEKVAEYLVSLQREDFEPLP